MTSKNMSQRPLHRFQRLITPFIFSPPSIPSPLREMDPVSGLCEMDPLGVKRRQQPQEIILIALRRALIRQVCLL